MTIFKDLFRRFKSEKVISKREHIFETNSSSTHSLVMAMDDDFVTDDFSQKVTEKDWNEEHYVLVDWKSKLVYLVAGFQGLERDMIDDIENTNIKDDINFKSVSNNKELFDANIYSEYFESLISYAFKDYTGLTLQTDIDVTNIEADLYEFRDFLENVMTALKSNKEDEYPSAKQMITFIKSFIFDNNVTVAFDTDYLDDYDTTIKYDEYQHYWSPNGGDTKRRYHIKKGWVKDE